MKKHGENYKQVHGGQDNEGMDLRGKRITNTGGGAKKDDIRAKETEPLAWVHITVI